MRACVDLLQDTAAVQVSSLETKTEPLREEELWFWLGEIAAYDTAEDSAYYNATLLEHAPPPIGQATKGAREKGELTSFQVCGAGSRWP